MGKLSTRVLDAAHARPAAGMRVELWLDRELIVSIMTDADGRCGGPLLEGAALVQRGTGNWTVMDKLDLNPIL